MSLSSIVCLAAVVAALLWRLYRAALPKPIPGIPFMPASAQRLLGDVPDALEYHARTSEMIAFLVQRCEQLQSPVVQVFMRPFARPWVVLLDGREAQDVMARRGREFDRAAFFAELLKVTFPHNQVHMRTNDQWRFNRRLAGDAMSPQFLHRVAAPQVYESTLDLIQLWRCKMRLAKGRTIDVLEDTRLCTVDTIWAATFGVNLGSCLSQNNSLSEYESIPLPKSEDVLLRLPVTAAPAAYMALKRVSASSEIPMNSPFGSKHHWFACKFYPKLRWAIAYKDQLVREQVDAAWAKFGGGEEKQSDAIKSAVDLIIEREATLARKEGRLPEPHSKFIHDELAGFLNAGFETTSTAIAWGLKFLTKHPAVQRQLRQSLQEAFYDAASNGALPTAEDITKTSLPYLDAVIEETLRCSSVIPANIRMTTVDTHVLGYYVPAGINVFMPTMGPSFSGPAMPIDDERRSASSREFKADTQRWSNQDLAGFDPKRWLTRGAGGEPIFDGRAAPQQMFGAGVRSCFGRKLGYLEMRVIYTLLIWSFELLPTPEALTDFRAVDGITRSPQNVHVRLGPARTL